MSKKAEREQIPLTFDLNELPTAQHRAGLAGLILQIDSMGSEGNKRRPELVPQIESITATTATITFTRESMQGVFDELYAAKVVEVVVANKWPNVTPKPVERFIEKKDPKSGKMKTVPGFAYDIVQPQAPCLARYLQDTAKPWLNLWRRMIWEIPRGGNNVQARAPFNDVANKGACGEGANAWAQLLAFQEKQANSQLKTAPISGALMLGAQAVNAESIPFSGRVDQNFLLHFWQLVVLPFVPYTVSKKDAKVERIGYVLTIPDVADLRAFRTAFPVVLGQLQAEPEHPDRPPTTARVDLPAQANLEVLRKLKGDEPGDGRGRRPMRASRGASQAHSDRTQIQLRSTGQVMGEQWGGSVRAVESFHMKREGNNVKMLSFARVADRPGLVNEFAWITRVFRNPLFRAAQIRALLRAAPWHDGMIELFAKYPWPFFIECDDTPKFLPRFGRDARDLFRAFAEDVADMKMDEMKEDEQIKHLSLIIHRLIKRYVEGRAEKKTGHKVTEFKKVPVKNKAGETLKDRRGEDVMLPAYSEEFREAQQRVCSDAFLSMRSRHDQDFVAYFAGSICSVDHALSRDDYTFLIRVLMTNPDPNPVGRKVLSWEDVKAIAMIAVSACSFQVRPREPQTQGSVK